MFFLSVAEVVTLRTLFVRLLQLFMRKHASSLFSRLTLHGNVEILASFDMTSRWHSSFLLFFLFNWSCFHGASDQGHSPVFDSVKPVLVCPGGGGVPNA